MVKVTLETLEKIEEMGMEGKLVVRGFYQSIFDMVKNQSDWKGKISSHLFKDAVDAGPEVIRHAIIYFTGNPDCMVRDVGSEWRISTEGYRAGPCGH